MFVARFFSGLAVGKVGVLNIYVCKTEKPLFIEREVDRKEIHPFLYARSSASDCVRAWWTVVQNEGSLCIVGNGGLF